MLDHDFDLQAFFAALDARRLERKLTWADVAREMGGSGAKKGSASTLMGLRERSSVEGDDVLSMLCWLDCPAASFTHLCDR